MYIETIDTIISNLFTNLIFDLIIAILVLAITAYFCIKYKLDKRIIVLTIAFLVYTVISIGFDVVPFYNEVKNESYITYEGDFEVAYTTDKVPIIVRLLDSDKTKLEIWFKNNDISDMTEDGVCEKGTVNTGKIVYTQKSKYAVYFELVS